METVRVEALRAWEDVAPLREAIDALNLRSRRPCPFSTFEYLETFLAHDEYRSAGHPTQLLFLAALEGEQLIGYLPLTKARERLWGLPFGRIGLLVSHDTDRPHLVARTEDEARCSRAFFEHLLERERGWSFLELALQDDASGLNEPPKVSPLRFYVRRFETMPNTSMPLPYTSTERYLAAVSSSFRRNVQRATRRLDTVGTLEFVRSDDDRARWSLLELYLDLERRSWKAEARAGIDRSPARVDFFRALAVPGQPLALGFEFLLLDGVPVAGGINGTFAGNRHGLEMSFDRAYDGLGPGNVFSVLSIDSALRTGLRAYNVDGNYAYYKARMGGVVTPTHAVQVYRVGSLPWLKARAGALRRRLRPAEVEHADFNPDRRRVSAASPGEATGEDAPAWRTPLPPRLEERERARQAFEALAAQGVHLERRSHAEIQQTVLATQRTPEAV